MSNLLLRFCKSEVDDLLVLERGEGPYVFDTDGRRYSDALSSLFCAQIGYSHGEEMAAAASRQLTTLAFNRNWGTAHPAALELAVRLAAEAPGHLNRGRRGAARTGFPPSTLPRPAARGVQPQPRERGAGDLLRCYVRATVRLGRHRRDAVRDRETDAAGELVRVTT